LAISFHFAAPAAWSAEVDTGTLPRLAMRLADLIEQSCVPGREPAKSYAADRGRQSWGSTDEASKILLTDGNQWRTTSCVTEAKLGKSAQHPAKSTHASACGQRKNRGATTAWAIDMHDQVKTRSRREIPRSAKFLMR